MTGFPCRYLAPELLRGLPGPPADVFSVGLIFYEMILGVDLPNGGAEWQRLRAGNLSLPGHPPAWQRVALLMLDPEPTHRPSSEDVSRMLREQYEDESMGSLAESARSMSLESCMSPKSPAGSFDEEEDEDL